MKEIIKRTFNLDGDFLEVAFHYDELSGKYLGDYPDFSENPRYTPNGRPWIDVTIDDCPYATNREYHDCSTCDYMKRENKTDVIGICMNENLKKNGGKLK